MCSINGIKEYKESSIRTGHLKIREESPPPRKYWENRQGGGDEFGNMGNDLIDERGIEKIPSRRTTYVQIGLLG